ncbi:MAG: DUF5720 family protein [Eubacteriales bacterium]|nr:DUF5720 family protein [Eubacteriales bacterium]
MKTINLRTYYYPRYTTDVFVEVSGEVAEALRLMCREDNNRRHRVLYHRAYYSLDREDGIEKAALYFVEKSPEEILMEQEERRFLLLLSHMDEALSSLIPVQERRVRDRPGNLKTQEPPMPGHDLYGLERHFPETRHMVILDILNSESPMGVPGERYRFFLSDEGYKNAKASEARGEIKIRSHAVLRPKKRGGRLPPAQEK